MIQKFDPKKQKLRQTMKYEAQSSDVRVFCKKKANGVT